MEGGVGPQGTRSDQGLGFRVRIKGSDEGDIRKEINNNNKKNPMVKKLFSLASLVHSGAKFKLLLSFMANLKKQSTDPRSNFLLDRFLLLHFQS